MLEKCKLFYGDLSQQCVEPAKVITIFSTWTKLFFLATFCDFKKVSVRFIWSMVQHCITYKMYFCSFIDLVILGPRLYRKSKAS